MFNIYINRFIKGSALAVIAFIVLGLAISSLLYPDDLRHQQMGLYGIIVSSVYGLLNIVLHFPLTITGLCLIENKGTLDEQIKEALIKAIQSSLPHLEALILLLALIAWYLLFLWKECSNEKMVQNKIDRFLANSILGLLLIIAVLFVEHHIFPLIYGIWGWTISVARSMLIYAKWGLNIGKSNEGEIDPGTRFNNGQTMELLSYKL